MAKFRRKSAVIDAVLWTGEVTPELEAIFGDDEIVIKTSSPPYLSIRTRDHHELVPVGDWLVRSDKGSLFRCSADYFAQTYEPVSDTSHVYSQPQCTFHYCPHPDVCKASPGGCINVWGGKS